MKTLVIHPEDISTRFLSVIYEKTGWTIVRNSISKSRIKTLIKEHDRIIMLGHGTELGLLDIKNKRYIIDSTLVYLLREKECICIWCNADIFVKKYSLNGFYTGMIISEISEAVDNCVMTNNEHLLYSNILFAACIRDAINFSDFNNDGKMNALDIFTYAYSKYTSFENSVIYFNRNNLFYV